MKKCNRGTALLKQTALDLIEELAKLGEHYVLCPGTLRAGYAILDRKNGHGILSGEDIKISLYGDDAVYITHHSHGFSISREELTNAALIIVDDICPPFAPWPAGRPAVPPPRLDGIRFEARSRPPSTARGTSQRRGR